MVKDNFFSVLGNGPGYIPYLSGTVICFNNAQVSAERVIRISNARKLDQYRSFTVEGPCSNQFIDTLHTTATRLESTLRCWPSTGLATVLTLETMQVQYAVHRMPLAPDFKREACFAPRLAKASCYHNWLGERRLAFTMTNRPWASLFLSMPRGNRPRGKETSKNNPFCSLNADDMTLGTLDTLAGYTTDTWELFASPELIEATEHLFYLSRNSSTTENWWLYHDEASRSINRIFNCIAYCQQSLYCR